MSKLTNHKKPAKTRAADQAKVLECVNDAIISMDRDLVILSWNKGAERLYGWTADEAVGNRIVDLLKTRYPKDSLDLLLGTILETGHYEGQLVHHHKDGTPITVLTSGSLLTEDDGTAVGYVSINRDITDRQNAEEALRWWAHVFEHLEWGVVIGGDDATLSLMNAAFARMHGYTVEELTGRPIVDVFAPETREEVPQHIATAHEKGHHAFESIHIRKNGTRFPVQINLTAVKDKSGNVLYRAASVFDITERKELEAQLLQAQKLETIGTMAGGIAHDFNNILGPILGYTDMLLADQPEDSRIRTDLEHIMCAANRAKDLVQQILLFSRRGEQDRKPVQIQLIVNEAVKLLKATFPSTIEIRQTLDQDCGAVLADPTQVHQVLLNLCTNARHAMRETGGVLTVQLNAFEADEEFVRGRTGMTPGQYVELTVSDTGHGIDEPSLERIFEPFFTTKHAGEGTGLGLSVAHGIVVRHGGMITVESEPDKRTSFHVYLPRAEVEDVQVDPETLPRAVNNESVLYVEDRHDVASVGRTMMERLGYRVTVALSGMDALEMFREDPDRFDVVLTDQTMPGMTGAELARELLRIRPDLPIVLMTGYSEAVTSESARRIGIRGYLKKPIVTRELAVAVRAAVDEEPAAAE